jgi:hypothetical protein
MIFIMLSVIAGGVFLLSAAFLAAAPPLPGGPSACSSDAFTIDGSSLAVSLCAPAEMKGQSTAVVVETLTVKGQPPYVRNVTLELVPGAESSRTIDDVPLQRLGIAHSLHLTIAFKNGSVRLEHALLVPGAIALK